MKKQAAAKLTKEIINGQYGPFEAYLIGGDVPADTMTIKDSLKQMGFKWFNGKWWISSKKLNSNQLNYLTSVLKVQDLSSLNSASPTETPIAQPSSNETSLNTEPKVEPKIGAEPKAEPKIGLVDPSKLRTEDPDATKWTGFPVNKNIYQFVLKMVDGFGNDREVLVEVDREMVYSDSMRKTKSMEHRRHPNYSCRISDKQTNKYITTKKFKSKDAWGTYSEDVKLKEIEDGLQKYLDNKEKSKTWKEIDLHYDSKNKPDDLKQIFLKLFDKPKNAPEVIEFSSKFNVKITDSQNPEYNGEYPVAIHSFSKYEKDDEKNPDSYEFTYNSNLVLSIDSNLEKLDQSYKSYDSYLTTLDIYGIKTVEEFYSKLNQLLQSKEVTERYLKRLQSFPFLNSQKSTGNEELVKIKKIMANPDGNLESVFSTLKSMNYIRESLRKIKGNEWVLNSKQIVDEIYSGGFNSNLPNYFFTVLAYFMHRELKGISSFTDIMLMDSLRVWRNSLSKFGFDLKMDEIENIVTKIGRALLKKYWNGFNSQNEKNEYFRNNWDKDWNSSSENKNNNYQQQNQASSLDLFKNFAEKLGIDPIGIENGARKVYYKILKLIHPDLEQDPVEKDKKTEMTKELNNIWDKMPEIYKTSSNWYLMVR